MSTQENPQENLNEFWKTLGIPLSTLRIAISSIDLCFRANKRRDTRKKKVPCLVGESGIGKSDIVRQYALDRDWNYYVFPLAHSEPEDLGGMPMYGPNGEPYYQFCLRKEIYDLIQSSTPAILFFDEWNRAEKAVVTAAFQVLETRRMGSVELPDHIHLVAAMNPSDGGYLVNESEKDPAFRRRMDFIAVRGDKNNFLEWAENGGKLHPIVCDYVRRKGSDAVVDVASRDRGMMYTCPACLEDISDFMYTVEDMIERGETTWEKHRATLRNTLAGKINVGATDEFLAFYEKNIELIDPADVIEKYHKKARSKILRLVERHKHGDIMRTAESVASELASGRYDMEDYADNLSAFAQDIPNDATQAFISKLAGELRETGDAELRRRINNALRKNKTFREAFQSINASHVSVEEDRKNGVRRAS